jgi:hypothetical protein
VIDMEARPEPAHASGELMDTPAAPETEALAAFNDRLLAGILKPLKRRLEFFTRQCVDAAAPSNFAWSNPEALKLAAETEAKASRGDCVTSPPTSSAAWCR